MKIYCMLHYHGPTESSYGNAVVLGCFTDLATIIEAEEKYRMLSGFSRYPNGFCVVEHTVIGESDCDYKTVYLAEIYIHDDLFEFEHDFCLGVFANYASAEQQIAAFQQRNVQFIKKGGLTVSCTVDRYTLNQMEWSEGFTSDS